MPMTPEQLLAVQAAYSRYVPGDWKVVAVEHDWTSHAEDKAHVGCGICGDVKPYATMKRITWRPAGPSSQPWIELTHVSSLVCRNGVACRERRAERAVKLAAIAA